MVAVTICNDFGAQEINRQTDEETVETVTDFIWGTPKSPQLETAAMKLKDICSLKEKL